MSVFRLEKNSNTPTSISVEVPGSKSISNRALIAASLCENPVTLHNLLISQDTEAMIGCLKMLGINITFSDNSVTVHTSVHHIKSVSVELDANQSGTTIRFLTALCCLVPGQQTIVGKNSLLARPIKPLIKALTQLGADIDITEHAIVVKSDRLSSTTAELDASTSSQFLTALMLIAPVTGLEIKLTDKLASGSYIDVTKKLLSDWGVQVNQMNGKFTIMRQSYSVNEYFIDADASAAAYFWTLAALSNNQIEVRQINRDSVQGDVRILDILELAGCQVITTKTGTKVIGNENLKPVNVDMSNCPDQIQTIAVLAAFAEGTSKIAGIETLRYKETDRLAATINELAKMGIESSVNSGVLSINGGKPRAAAISTYEDHRTAMSFALAGTRLPGMAIENPEVVNKTFPEFWQKLEQCGVKII